MLREVASCLAMTALMLQTFYALYDGGGGVALDEGDYLYCAAVGLDEGGTYDLVDGVVAAFYEYVGAEGTDEGLGGVFIEEGDGIDTEQGGCLEGAILLVGNGAVHAFEALHGGIGIEGEDEDVAKGCGAGKQIEVAMVQDIEAAIGENYLFACEAPGVALVLECPALVYLILYPLQLVHRVCGCMGE